MCAQVWNLFQLLNAEYYDIRALASARNSVARRVRKLLLDGPRDEDSRNTSVYMSHRKNYRSPILCIKLSVPSLL